MFSFILGFAAGAVCVLNGNGTRRLFATVLSKGQVAAAATARETVRWSARLSEEVQDIVAEAKAEAANEAEARKAGLSATRPGASGSSATSQVH